MPGLGVFHLLRRTVGFDVGQSRGSKTSRGAAHLRNNPQINPAMGTCGPNHFALCTGTKRGVFVNEVIIEVARWSHYDAFERMHPGRTGGYA